MRHCSVVGTGVGKSSIRTTSFGLARLVKEKPGGMVIARMVYMIAEFAVFARSRI